MIVAIAIPHASWLPRRVENLRIIKRTICQPNRPEDIRVVSPLSNSAREIAQDRGLSLAFKTFEERETWEEYTEKMWLWALTLKPCPDYFLTLQDDVILAPHFWRAFIAMLRAWPNDFLSLAATHSLGPEVARQGRRSYLSAKVLGWGWSCPLSVLQDLYDLKAQKLVHYKQIIPNLTEDTLVANLLVRDLKIVPRSPVPTIVDHLDEPTTNPTEFRYHTHNKSTVTWRAFSATDMADPSWWQTPATTLHAEPTEVNIALEGPCTWCGMGAVVRWSPRTRAGLCQDCLFAPYRILDTQTLVATCIEPSCGNVRAYGPYCWHHFSRVDWCSEVQKERSEGC